MGAIAIVCAPELARAQAVHLDHFRPAETANDGFVISRPIDRGHMLLGATLALDHAIDPLVVERVMGDAGTETGEIVEHHVVATATLSFGLFDRLVLFAGLPVNLVMEGDDIPGAARADGSSLGDVFAGLRGRLIGENDDLASLALQLTATFPSGQAAQSSMRFSGEDGVTLHPELLFEVRLDFMRIALNLGARMRTTDNARFFDATGRETLAISHELTWGAGAAIPILEEGDLSLEANVEIWGASSFERFGDRAGSPVEALAGLRLRPIDPFVIGLAAGVGLSRGYGSPDFRGVLTVGFAEPIPPPPAPEPPPPPPDTDGDGLLDADDQCPREPEDRDEHEDEDGCADPDDDGDGLRDDVDECPREPEDADQFEDENGCPDPDNDADELLDANDACPLEPEDRDGFEDANGCVDPDNDADTILDAADECPLAPGPVETNGCPVNVRLEIETGRIVILRTVEFASNQDTILERSAPILEEVRAILAVNPEILRVRVEGHTDDRGRDAHNMDLSARRARSIVRHLVEAGIAAERLEAWGCGELHPLEPNDTRARRQANRRVEFHIVDPPPPSGAPAREGCTAIPIEDQ